MGLPVDWAAYPRAGAQAQDERRLPRPLSSARMLLTRRLLLELLKVSSHLWTLPLLPDCCLREPLSWVQPTWMSLEWEAMDSKATREIWFSTLSTRTIFREALVLVQLLQLEATRPLLVSELIRVEVLVNQVTVVDSGV